MSQHCLNVVTLDFDVIKLGEGELISAQKVLF